MLTIMDLWTKYDFAKWYQKTSSLYWYFWIYFFSKCGHLAHNNFFAEIYENYLFVKFWYIYNFFKMFSKNVVFIAILIYLDILFLVMWIFLDICQKKQNCSQRSEIREVMFESDLKTTSFFSICWYFRIYGQKMTSSK